jgi:hypothetical protein
VCIKYHGKIILSSKDLEFQKRLENFSDGGSLTQKMATSLKM